ncbi:HIT family protein [Halovivax sp.]|uniref:HIT family protein n=1 Tax=Halovivax sp. TaxID=1935978 RepID=UPI0025BEACAD|nr:HIT domain-containing protein [Halovivax sp.]
MDEDCPFCAIVAGDRSANVVYEDGGTVAFLDENPAARGHALVVPRAHREEILTDADGAAASVFETVSTVAEMLQATLEPDGFSVFHTSGPLVGTVHHAHVHVVPRFADDGIGLSLARDALDDEEGARLAEEIRANG